MAHTTKYIGVLGVSLLVPIFFIFGWMSGAKASMKSAQAMATNVAIASASEDSYCSQGLKLVLRRVASACGLVEGSTRGCKPTDAKSVVALAGEDFNAIFKPLASRASIIQFDSDQVELDEGARQTVEKAWSDQKGGSFFFVVARASSDGDAEHNQVLSEQRAHAVLNHLENAFHDPELKKEVGLMWLGEEFAQLSEEFCQWNRSRATECTIKDINRSAFVAWIDCAI